MCLLLLDTEMAERIWSGGRKDHITLLFFIMDIAEIAGCNKNHNV